MSEKRYVENNTFISTYPRMAIKVRPELKYLGEYHGDLFKDVVGDYYTQTKVEQVFYIFCQKGDDGNAKKALAIRISSVPDGFYWRSDSFATGSKIDSGKTEVGGMNWVYAVWATNDLFGLAKNFIQNQGFSTTNQHLLGAIGKIVTPDRTTKMIVYYAEDLEDTGYPSYAQWNKRVSLLSDNQRKFVNEFIDRGFKTIQFLQSESTE